MPRAWLGLCGCSVFFPPLPPLPGACPHPADSWERPLWHPALSCHRQVALLVHQSDRMPTTSCLKELVSSPRLDLPEERPSIDPRSSGGDMTSFYLAQDFSLCTQGHHMDLHSHLHLPPGIFPTYTAPGAGISHLCPLWEDCQPVLQ